MQSYRFDGLVQGRLLQIQLALLKLVKVIPTLRRTQTGHFEEVQTTERSFLPSSLPPGAEGEAPGAAPLIKQTGSVSPPLTRVQHDTTAGLRLYFRMLMEKFNRFNLCLVYRTALGAETRRR